MSPGPAGRDRGVLDVVIVNWNTGDCLRACLGSLASAGSGLRLGSTVVVDNASTDDSAARLPDSPELVVVRNRRNVGFAAACNQGARVGEAPYLLFLNPDTVLRPDTLSAALRFLDAPEGAAYGVCGGLILEPDGGVGISASRFPTLANVVTGTLGLERLLHRWVPPRHLPPAELTRSRPVDQVIGAFFLVRRSLFHRLGGFDERYFLYYEEVDFCRRAARLGAPAYLLTEAKLFHAGNVSAKKSGGRALLYSIRSRTLYAARHWSAAQAAGLAAFTLAVEMPARFLQALLRRDAAELAAVVRASGGYAAFLAQRFVLGPRLLSTSGSARGERRLPFACWRGHS